MPLQLAASKRRNSRLLLPWLAAAVPLVCGAIILSWEADRSLNTAAVRTSQLAIEQFELILDNVAAAADAVLPLSGQPCAQVQPALLDQVTRRPFVRSVNLIDAGTLYCSSLSGNVSEAVDALDYVDGQLWLLAGNPVTPDRGLLIYRATRGQASVLSTVDGYHLSNALRMMGSANAITLQVGPNWIEANGKVHQGTAPVSAVAHTQLKSARYPFSVVSGFPAGARWTLIREQYIGMFSLLLLIAAVAGGLCRWAMSRSPSRYQELQRALDAGEFVPFFQPIVFSQGGAWAGVEVLMRWQHPREGLVRPDLFIPYAEDCGLIVPMTRLLMKRTAQQLAGCLDHLPVGFHVGINITARHCQDPALFDDCKAFLEAFPQGRVALTLELTERELIQPCAEIHGLFDRLRGLGVSIAIDDFGTGQSSLSYLQQFKVDLLKIDQSFVAMIGVNTLSRHVLDSIIELSAKLGLQVVAEGVETEEQRAYLAARDVKYLQGYLFARPMPPTDFERALRQG
ncbi:EAL domain-containing protein [Pseudomonas coleopterorum]|uniref:EAL domain-containing protein n=1 Tax=Pseudomonas coleopterorum TaxID=1605838 RepID=UPI002A6A954F|nr:EAL domain-containing protein [Pseudomonas coleopterorum]MDY1045349.1 EAL domain-containing protein [Pseudomonas coleopterorum]